MWINKQSKMWMQKKDLVEVKHIRANEFSVFEVRDISFERNKCINVHWDIPRYIAEYRRWS